MSPRSAAQAFFADDPSMNKVRTLRSVIEEGLENYAGIFVPGGQAPVVDLMQDPDMGEILRVCHAEKKPTALLCHGPIALIAAMPSAPEFRAAMLAGDTAKARELAKGWQYAGYKMTIFSNTEEKVVDALEVAGGEVITTEVDFEPNVIVDRELITGQNPRSDHLTDAKLVEALERASVAA
jgi:putative intracellular protease/amidase